MIGPSKLSNTIHRSRARVNQLESVCLENNEGEKEKERVIYFAL